jgi:hypothetical protein
VEDGLGLTTVTGLLAVITTLTLCEQRGLSCLVFYIVSACEGYVWQRGPLTGDLVLGVLLAVLALAVGSAGLGNVDLRHTSQHLSDDLLCSCCGFPRTAEHATRADRRYRRERRLRSMRWRRLVRMGERVRVEIVSEPRTRA